MRHFNKLGYSVNLKNLLHIKLTDDISVDLKWHTMKDRLTSVDTKTETDAIINMVAKSIETIYSGEEIFNCADSPRKEVLDFVESLNTDQFNEIVDILSKSPYLFYDIKFDCKKCSKDNTMTLNGLIDFFQYYHHQINIEAFHNEIRLYFISLVAYISISFILISGYFIRLKITS